MSTFATYPSLAGMNAFVTGGATGIGAALVKAYAAQGAKVGFVDINADAGNELCQSLRDAGASVWFQAVDVCDIHALQAAITTYKGTSAPLDILVNNVANDTRHDWRDVTVDDWDRAMAVNLRPTFFAIQSVAADMIRRKKGAIVNFGSIAWKAKHGGMPAYTTAKAAIHGLTRSFIREFGTSGVRVNTVLPGMVLTTRQLAEHYSEDVDEILKQNQPMAGRITEEDVASLVMFLSADDSKMCTGQEFTLDGGWL